MGYIKHDAIIVTAFKRSAIDAAELKAVELSLDVSSVVASKLNGYFSILIAPDGSKEGWTDSDAGDHDREAWKDWARGDARDLGLKWVHVQYAGDDSDDTCVVDSEPPVGATP